MILMARFSGCPDKALGPGHSDARDQALLGFTYHTFNEEQVDHLDMESASSICAGAALYGPPAEFKVSDTP